MGKWITRIAITSYIDTLTGELVRIEAFEIKKKEYEIYMKSYLENIKADNIEFNNTEYAVLIKLKLELKHSSSLLRISSSLIKEFASDRNLNRQSIYNAINRLAEIKVLMYVGNDTFHLNPKYYWNGTEADKIKEILMIREKLKEIQKDEEIKN